MDRKLGLVLLVTPRASKPLVDLCESFDPGQGLGTFFAFLGVSKPSVWDFHSPKLQRGPTRRRVPFLAHARG